jgi:uncharacterized membrane protein
MSTTLTAWTFPRPHAAEAAVRKLRELARERQLVIYDAATVEWGDDAVRPTASQLRPITDVGALGDTFWGRLFGHIFAIPLLDEANATLNRTLTDHGIDDHFVLRLREGLMPGTSVLFVMSPDAVVDKIRDAFDPHAPELSFISLRRVSGCGSIDFS